MRFKVERTKEGRIYLDLYNDLVNVWRGFSLTDGEAKELADALLREVKPTASELTRDVDLEP